MRTLFTVGYERADIAALVAALRVAGVEVLVDIRALPISRKPGFSKSALARHLAETGISYVHAGRLGNPKPGRDAARRGDVALFRSIFSQHLNSACAQEALTELARLAESSIICLLCFERDHLSCHRSIVSAALAEVGNFDVKHISLEAGVGTSSGRRNDCSFGERAVR